jgi:hypothetical protein
MTRHALSWADVLHEGPVPGGLSDDPLSREYPSTRDGLSLTERRILAAPLAEGASPRRCSGSSGRGRRGRSSATWRGAVSLSGVVERRQLELAPGAGFGCPGRFINVPHLWDRLR